MDIPLLSIIIPTRNRYKTLIPVIESINGKFSNSKIEILVQDNSDDNNSFTTYLETHKLEKVKYYYNPSKLSMVENSELAIANSSGKYLIFIGDDDIVNPKILDVVNTMEEENIKSIIYPIANYFYPDVEFHKEYGFHKPGLLSFNTDLNFNITKLDTKHEIERVEQIGGIFILDLPRLYHGIINRDLIEEVRSVYGKFVPGPCPDMTTSAAIATLINHHHRINIPLSVAGNSSASEGGKGPTNAHVVKLEEKSWLNQKDIEDWNPSLPRIFSRETIWSQSFYHVLSLRNAPKLNYKAVYDSMIFSCPKQALPLVNQLYLNNGNGSKNYLNLFKSYFKRYFKILLFTCPSAIIEKMMKIRGDYKTKQEVADVKSINDVMNILEKNSNK
ncbi:hypothetical protein GCM10022216_32180 [Sphingobacterium kyonggiense]|uniref:Glycosyltransferase 2-like domain-containing protein n=1 Tax=Sphingobacterium kyonggiense TaxID=714075 RepID=A0ABP7Z3U0_9SPHI